MQQSSRSSRSKSSVLPLDEEDEGKILATIGSKVANAERYEANVIREVSYQSAPRLGGIGFPDLATLSNSNSNGIEIMGALSTKFLKEIGHLQPSSETRAANVLRMKYQILQSYLSNDKQMDTFANNDAKKTEISFEKRRSAALKAAETVTAINDVHANNFFDGSRNSLPSSSTLTPLQTLEHAKKGLLPLLAHNESKSGKNVSYFGKQALLDRQSSVYTKSIHQRQSMMERKRKLDDTTDNDDKSKLAAANLSVDTTEDYLIYLKKLREERREARRQKKREEKNDDDLSFKGRPSNALDDNRASADETEGNESIKAERNIESNTSISDENGYNDSESAAIICPICACKFADITSDPDEFLSKHMDQCQLKQPRRTTRSTSRLQSNSQPKNKSLDCLTKDDNNTTKDLMFEDDLQDSHESDNDLEYQPKSTNTGSSIKRLKKKAVCTKSANFESCKKDNSKQTNSRDDLELWEYEDRVDRWIESGVSKMITLPEQNAQEIPPGKVCFPGAGGLTIPAWTNNRLFSYQRSALRWLWELHKQQSGAILGDEMGLGKTVQVASFLGAMTLSRKLDCILLISPATMLDHWLRELTIWAPGLRRILVHKSGESYDGFSRDVSSSLLKKLDKWLANARSQYYNEPLPSGDGESSADEEDDDTFCGNGYIIVTTYENIRKNVDIWVNHHWSYVVIDEGQRIKNPNADVTLACKRLRTPHRVLVTATPISNNLVELWSLFDFAVPGRLGTLPSFETEFAEPIKRGGYANASQMQVQLAYRCALVLRDLVNPYLLRRQKKDIEEVQRLPGKTEHILFCRLSDRQKMLYEAYLKSDEMKLVLQGSSQCFRAITVLRKICNHPDLVCEENKESLAISSDDESTSSTELDRTRTFSSDVETCGKLLVLAKVLPLWKKQSHRVLIFCQWKKMLNILQSFMVENGWKFSRLDGTTKVGSRQALVDKFNNDISIFAMLLTTRTGGVGLNLVGASRCILWDPDWNPQVDAQARERSYRFGQTKEVTIYRMITAGTIEEKIYHRQIFKTALSERVLQDPKQRRLFSQKDLRDLFTLKSDDASGENLSETAYLMKANGVVHAAESKDEDKNTIGALLRNKGLAYVFDHDVVDESSSCKKSRVEKEMEEKAQDAADRAKIAIQQSTADQHQCNSAFIPTWTGSVETLPRRFGPKIASVSFPGAVNNMQPFGSSIAAGFHVSNDCVETKSSVDILAKLRSQRQ